MKNKTKQIRDMNDDEIYTYICSRGFNPNDLFKTSRRDLAYALILQKPNQVKNNDNRI